VSIESFNLHSIFTVKQELGVNEPNTAHVFTDYYSRSGNREKKKGQRGRGGRYDARMHTNTGALRG